MYMQNFLGGLTAPPEPPAGLLVRFAHSIADRPKILQFIFLLPILIPVPLLRVLGV